MRAHQLIAMQAANKSYVKSQTHKLDENAPNN